MDSWTELTLRFPNPALHPSKAEFTLQQREQTRTLPLCRQKDVTSGENKRGWAECAMPFLPNSPGNSLPPRTSLTSPPLPQDKEGKGNGQEYSSRVVPPYGNWSWRISSFSHQPSEFGSWVCRYVHLTQSLNFKVKSSIDVSKCIHVLSVL